MSGGKKHRKQIRLTEVEAEKIQQVKNYKNAENELYGIPILSDTDVIVDAVDFYHSHLFGKDVLESTTQKLETIIASSVKLSLKEITEKFALALNRLNYNDDKMIESIFLLMMASGIVADNQQLVNESIQRTDYYHDMIDHALRLKNERD